MVFPTVCEAAGIPGGLDANVRSMCERLWIIVLCGSFMLLLISLCLYKLIVALFSDDCKIHPALLKRFSFSLFSSPVYTWPAVVGMDSLDDAWLYTIRYAAETAGFHNLGWPSLCMLVSPGNSPDRRRHSIASRLAYGWHTTWYSFAQVIIVISRVEYEARYQLIYITMACFYKPMYV
ncbi:uncharacterized protein LOC111266993 [Varroa jacobsoni]|uniref:uncharacterized protein LOC111266993 n=1 Tax=Varroa jacobsoni TaxID=62625 RepID=UPI000BF27E2C|nr:uncharacterized protein LOC111266993 [Varroa jacobsoni]XP_022700645.1 uncharacterized protein LOC111266993 [Varroa jacobsoni]XP_022700646.1 uncharacterized protein LOC111266993 [Varroa jacobsoni]